MKPLQTTKALAETHEALWLRLAGMHKDTLALGAKKPEAVVSEPLRIVAEGLLCDCAPFIRQKGQKLPVAAPDLAGLGVQLGQALAALEAWQNRFAEIDAQFNCLMWRVGGAHNLPVMRLKPPAAAIRQDQADDKAKREKLVHLLVSRHNRIYEEGFKAGLAARQGPPEAMPIAGTEPAPEPVPGTEEQTYPRVRSLV